MKTGSLRAPASCRVWPVLFCTAVTRGAFCVGACLWSNFRDPRTVGESAVPSSSYSLLALAAHCVRGKADPGEWWFLRLLVSRNYCLQSLDSWCEKPARTQGHFSGSVEVWLVCTPQTSQCLGGSSESSDTSSFHFELVFRNRITKLLIKQNKDLQRLSILYVSFKTMNRILLRITSENLCFICRKKNSGVGEKTRKASRLMRASVPTLAELFPLLLCSEGWRKPYGHPLSLPTT